MEKPRKGNYCDAVRHMKMSLGKKLNRLRRFVEGWAYRIGKLLEDELHFSTSHRFLHFWILVGRNFVYNRCPGRAGALAFTTVLALIPLLAIAISVSTGILQNQGTQATQNLTEKLIEYIAPQLELIPKGEGESASGKEQVLEQITNFVQNIRSGALGVTGMIALVLIAISMVNTIESTFNDIWGVEHGRSWLTRIVHYWSVLTLGPLLLVMLIGITTVPYLEGIQAWFKGIPLVGELAGPSFRYITAVVLFSLLYQFMPNTQVRWFAAFVGGVVGACLWQLYNSSNALFVSRVMREADIYGNFAVVPIFLFGMYLSWLILLFGAQVAHAYQNRQHYLQGKMAESINERGRELAAFRIMTLIAQRFDTSAAPPTVSEICTLLNLPDQLVRQLCHRLITYDLIHQVSYPKLEGYFPSRPLDRIRGADILDAVRGRLDGLPVGIENPDAWYRTVRREFDRIQNAELTVAEEVTVADLARQRNGVAPTEPEPAGTQEEHR